MKKTWVVLLGLILLLTAGCRDAAVLTVTPTPSADVSTEPGAGEAGPLNVLGTILPAQRVKLGFSTGGPVSVVNAQVGMEVKAGELLAELEITDLGMEMQEAEDGLALSEALLDQAKAGAREQELLIAEAEYQRTLA